MMHHISHATTAWSEFYTGVDKTEINLENNRYDPQFFGTIERRPMTTIMKQEKRKRIKEITKC